MSTPRREIQERKDAMLRDLRLAHSHGVALPGEMAVSQRELSAKYGLSVRTISIEMQKLVEEGVLYTIPRVGTFVGRPQVARNNLFLILFGTTDEPNSQQSAMRAGFEDRIASLGGTSLVLDFATASQYCKSGEIAPAGVFEFNNYVEAPIWLEEGVPHVEFGQLETVHTRTDAVYFDNVEGGWKATRHLLAMGHKNIAFMGLHNSQDNPGILRWSRDRETGWRRAMNESGFSSDSLNFQPEEKPDVETHSPEAWSLLEIASAEVAAQLLKDSSITAVVAVNAHTAHALIEGLRSTNRPVDKWPAVVGFDTEIPKLKGQDLQFVTTLRLPWEDIGREAADLLWERANGRLAGLEQRLVPMTLIPRFSCRQEWHLSSRSSVQPEKQVVAMS